jgi:hypothetical protein
MMGSAVSLTSRTVRANWYRESGTSTSPFLLSPRLWLRCAFFYVFDLLWLDESDLRELPIIERKLRLKRLLRGRRARGFSVPATWTDRALNYSGRGL